MFKEALPDRLVDGGVRRVGNQFFELAETLVGAVEFAAGALEETGVLEVELELVDKVVNSCNLGGHCWVFRICGCLAGSSRSQHWHQSQCVASQCSGWLVA